MLLCIVPARMPIRDGTEPDRVRTGPTNSRNDDGSQYAKEIISHDMHRALHEILVVYCCYALHTHGTCCMIHACSLYLYVVRFGIC